MIKWDDEENPLWLITQEELDILPEGIELECIDGKIVVKGRDYIDNDTRFGHIAYGVRTPNSHKYRDIFTEMSLKT